MWRCDTYPSEIAERKRGLAGKVRAGWMRREGEKGGEERRGVWKDILYGPLAEQGKT
jgi:hypothetical protein